MMNTFHTTCELDIAKSQPVSSSDRWHNLCGLIREYSRRTGTRLQSAYNFLARSLLQKVFAGHFKEGMSVVDGLLDMD